jgi:orotidine-5'-phosphate decarboxylase
MRKSNELLVALDVNSGDKAMQIAGMVGEVAGGFKVGKRLFVLEGPSLVRRLQEQGHKIFLDLKFHDISNTVAQAIESAAQLGVWMCNVHCSGGLKMMTAARDAAYKYAAEHNGVRPLVIGVTVLTDHTSESLEEIGYPAGVDVKKEVERLTRLAAKAGLDGVVCSAQETPIVRNVVCDESFLVVNPGIRLGKGTVPNDDQERVDTPRGAKKAGASYIVVGRPIIESPEPFASALAFGSELAAV